MEIHSKTIGRLNLIVVDRGEINTHVENRERVSERQTDRKTDREKHRQGESVRAG